MTLLMSTIPTKPFAGLSQTIIAGNPISGLSVLNGRFQVHRYCQATRINNYSHDKTFYIEHKFYDKLRNLREDHDRLSQLRSKPTNVQVARAYFTSNIASRTTTMCELVDVHLPIEIL